MERKIGRKLSETPICGIYCVTNQINSKIYIGQSVDIERRWNQHKYHNNNLVLKHAIKKYGLNNFRFEILETIDTNNKTKTQIQEILTELEQKWFNNKEPFRKENGYNINKTSKPNFTEKRAEGFGKKNE